MIRASAGLALIATPLVTRAAETAGASSAGSLFQVFFGLAFVLMLMAAAAWTLKRFGISKMARGSVARVVGGVSVGGRERVVVVEIADQWIVVGVAPGSVTSLAALPRQENAVLMDDAVPAAKNFSAWLKQTIDKRNAR